jgi:predicted DNA-binding transcriptional regulator YafY
MPDLDELAGFGELADLPALDQPDLAGGDHADDEEDLAAALADRAGQLAPGERRLLAHAIETEGAVEIGYTNAQGNHTTRVIDSVELDGGHLIAWCHLRDDERIFSLHRIDSVAPAS